MNDRYGKIIRKGDTLLSSYGIPPRRIEAQVVRQMYGGQDRLMVLTPGHSPERCTLATFMESMGAPSCVEIISRDYNVTSEGSNE